MTILEYSLESVPSSASLPLRCRSSVRRSRRGRCTGSATSVLGAFLALADRDVRTREAERTKSDLNVIFEVLERNRHAREQRISALVR